jgi:AraC-like DNA-binding protein
VEVDVVMHSVKSVVQSHSNDVESFSPAVCRAGYFQFSANQRFINECVQSRGLYWCKSGHGRFEVNGVSYELEPHDLYVLPWNRNIAHFPDTKKPMHTGHVHVVPDYRLGSKWIPNVPHDRGEVMFDSPDRQDVDWPGFEDTYRLKIKTDEPIGLLLDYAIRWYMQSGGENEEESRSLAQLIVNELFRKRAEGATLTSKYPEELERMVVHVNNGFHLSPTVSDLSDLIGRSRSHVLKLFSKYLGVSPKSYIIDCQLREARELLLSTIMPIAEIGQSVGLSDPYHFSKLFRRHVGIPPSEFRQKHGPFSTPPKISAHRPFPVKPIE